MRRGEYKRPKRTVWQRLSRGAARGIGVHLDGEEVRLIVEECSGILERAEQDDADDAIAGEIRGDE